MSHNRLGAVLLLAACAAIHGCSSRVEVELEREEARTAVRTEPPAENAGESHSRMRLHVVAEGQADDPLSTTIAADRARPQSGPADARGAEGTADRPAVVAGPAPTIAIGSVHIGDVHVHRSETHVTVVVPERPTDLGDLLPVRASEIPAAPNGAERCERLRREHEARIEQWSKLFRR
jgi:hypothetical protein